MAAFSLSACHSLRIDSEKPTAGITPFWTGYIVRDSQGTVVDSLNAGKLFIPASLTKLFWYPEWKMLQTDSLFSQTVIRYADSSLVIQAPGNPLLKFSDLKLNPDSLPVFRNIIIQHLPYDQQRTWGTGWMYDDEPSDYQPYFSSVPVDFNTISVQVSGEGKEPGITIEPMNLPVTVFQGTTVKISRKRDSDTILVSMGSGTDSLTISRKLSVKYPQQVLTNWLTLWSGGKPVHWQPVTSFDNRGMVIKTIHHPFDSLVQAILFESNNLAAEQVARYISLLNKGNGSFADFYQTRRLPDSSGQLVDGSGLSRYNLLSPLSIDQVLHHEKQALVNHLPVYAKEGTLKNRGSVSNQWKIVAKSGSMNGIQNLAGYFVKDGNVSGSFVLMVNHTLQPKETRFLFEQHLLKKWISLLDY